MEYFILEAFLFSGEWRAENGLICSAIFSSCSEVNASEMLVKAKPQSICGILYISCQLRMLGALRHADLDFSKVRVRLGIDSGSKER